MAENLDDGEFWLPPQFLADDDTPKKLNSFNTKNDNVFETAPQALFSSDFTYLSSPSPVESVVGSSEAESDEEEHMEHMAELTRQMAHSTLETNFNRTFNNKSQSKGMFVSGSPQSTLCAFGCGKSSSQGSSNSVCCEVNSQRATWDLLREAAGEVERMSHNGSGLLVPPEKPSPTIGFYTQQQQSFSHQQLQIAQFEGLRQQQMAKQQGSVWGGVQLKGGAGPFQQRQSNQMVPNRGRNSGDVVGVRNFRGNLGLSPSAWPPLQQVKQIQQNQQQQYGSGMRAVFLGNHSGKRESAGTGVFLPRRVDSPVESRRKPACSTVLVPARVAQALNLKLEDMVGGQPRYNGALIMENASAIPRIRSSTYGFSQQKRNLRPQPQANHEIRLPQEWTY